MKTVKEVSELLNVSKQTIHYHLKNLPSNFKVKKSGNKSLIEKRQKNRLIFTKNRQMKKRQRKTNIETILTNM